MKIAVFGVWHVHAPDYTRKAQAYGEVIGFYEKNDALAEGFAKEFGLYRFATPEELLAYKQRIHSEQVEAERE